MEKYMKQVSTDMFCIDNEHSALFFILYHLLCMIICFILITKQLILCG